MKYILLFLLLAVICFLAGALLVRLISRRKKPLRRSLRILLSIVFGVLLIAAAGLVYLLPYSHADPAAEQFLKTDASVSVTEISGGWFFDGPGEDTALIFYPGAKVDTKAYAPLMHSAAAGGCDCFLMDMPLHMAFFRMNAADEVLQTSDYEHYYLAGHSLGGTVVSGYAAGHPDDADALILLASYPSKALPEKMKMLSIYGSEDGILNLGAYEESQPLWPPGSEEYCIEGGNHAGFACYGPQKGDRTAAITPEEQQRITADLILQFTGLSA